MSLLGNALIFVALIASILSAVQYYRSAKSDQQQLRRARLLLRIGVGTIILLCALLLTLLLKHDFSNGYVYGYSSRDLPLHFLISSFYAGQEGSFLFWALCSALIGLTLMWYTRRRQSEAWVMSVFMATQAFLLLLLYAKTPFKSVWDTIPDIPAGVIPPDGRGLNPLLQNFWMVIHPPVLFIGFAAMAVPFSFAIATMWRKELALLSSQALGWLLFTVFILGSGIMLGAYWAYGVLGWGGYWGWDPVENSSLVPWLTGVALVHTLVVQRRTGKFVRLNLSLAIISFFLVIYSTFLTRSGVLGEASVHSFVDPGATVYWLLIAFLVAIAVVGFGFMFVRRQDLRPSHSDNEFISKETALALGVIALLLSAVVTLFGTSLPLFGKSTVDVSFYNTMNLPLVVAMVLFIGLSLYTQWSTDRLIDILKRAWKWIMVSLGACVVLIFFGVTEAAVLLLVFVSAFGFLVNLDLGLKQGRLDIGAIGGKLAHIGLAAFLVGVIGSGKFSSTRQVALPLNQPVQALDHTLTYTGYSPTLDNKYAFNVSVEKNGAPFTLSPVMFEGGQQGTMRNPDIKSFLTSDFYISPMSLEQPEQSDAGHGEKYIVEKGKTIQLGEYKATFLKFDMNTHTQGAMTGGAMSEMAVGAVIELSDGKSKETVTPVMMYGNDGGKTYEPAESKLLHSPIRLVSMNVGGMGGATSSVTIEVLHAGEEQPKPDALIVEASVKPLIGLVWVGTFVMFVGFLVAMIRRLKGA